MDGHGEVTLVLDLEAGVLRVELGLAREGEQLHRLVGPAPVFQFNLQ